MDFTCLNCNIKFTRTKKQIKKRSNKPYKFCSNTCSNRLRMKIKSRDALISGIIDNLIFTSISIATNEPIKINCLTCKQYKTLNKFYNNKNNIKRFKKQNDCKLCDNIRTKKRTKKKKYTLKDFMSYLINSCRGSGINREKRGRPECKECNLTIENLKLLKKKQKNKCIYSGINLIWKPNSGIHKVSIDRIDNNKGYIFENIQLTSWCVNQCKSNYPDKMFLFIVKLIYEYKTLKIKNNYIFKDNFKIVKTNKKTKNIKNKLKIIDNIKYLLCSRCSKYKLFDDFYNNKSNKYEKQSQCKKCNNERKKKRGYTETGFLTKLLNSCKQSSKNRIKKGRNTCIFNITKNDIIKLKNKQKNKCVYTNLELIWKVKTGWRMCSIDRINSNKGYTKDNIQLVCWCVNKGKSAYSNNIFLEFIKNIYNFKNLKNYIPEIDNLKKIKKNKSLT